MLRLGGAFVQSRPHTTPAIHPKPRRCRASDGVGEGEARGPMRWSLRPPMAVSPVPWDRRSPSGCCALLGHTTRQRGCGSAGREPQKMGGSGMDHFNKLGLPDAPRRHGPLPSTGITAESGPRPPAPEPRVLRLGWGQGEGRVRRTQGSLAAFYLVSTPPPPPPKWRRIKGGHSTHAAAGPHGREEAKWLHGPCTPRAQGRGAGGSNWLHNPRWGL